MQVWQPLAGLIEQKMGKVDKTLPINMFIFRNCSFM